jgi:selenocysteine lyase/cysteine desulfurase
VTFTVDGVAAAAVQQHLRQQNINVTTSTVRSTRLDMEDRQLAEVVRASIHYFNNEAEIERFCGEIRRLGTGDSVDRKTLTQRRKGAK